MYVGRQALIDKFSLINLEGLDGEGVCRPSRPRRLEGFLHMSIDSSIAFSNMSVTSFSSLHHSNPTPTP